MVKFKTITQKLASIKKGWYILAVFLIALISLGVITFLSVNKIKQSAQKAMLAGQQAYAAFKSQDLVKANEELRKTKTELEQTQQDYQSLSWTKHVPYIKNYYTDGKHAIKAGLLSVDAGIQLTGAINPYADVLGFQGEGTFTGGSVEERLVKIVETLGKITPDVDEAIEKLSQAQAEFGQIDPNRYPKEFRGTIIRKRLQEAEDQFEETIAYLEDFQPILHTLPEMLGYPDERKYLVIFQNDGELRATGGFMTAYAILKADSGKITAEGSNDIYHLDEKFNSNVDAPDPIKRYLLSADLNVGLVPNWYLRDMNLSPDYKVSMDTFNKYYEQVPGEPEVQGIIAIDTKILKDLVTLLGPLDVPGYGKFTMEPDDRCHGIPNLICELEHLVGIPIPGIRQDRKGVLGPMMQAIMQKAMTAPTSHWPAFFKLAIQNMQEKHFLMYYMDETEQEAAEEINAAGRISSYEGDYLHINNSNFGGAKSNFFVEQKVKQEVSFDNGRLKKKLEITYTNPEPMDNCNLERETGLCLNGILRDYVRIYVPKGSELIEFLGSETEPQTYQDLDKQVFEGFFTLRGDGGRAKLVVEYYLPENTVNQNNYKLLVQKQPGTREIPHQIIFDGKQKEIKLNTDQEVVFEK